LVSPAKKKAKQKMSEHSRRDHKKHAQCMNSTTVEWGGTKMTRTRNCLRFVDNESPAPD